MGHNQHETPNHGPGLEEIVLQKVPHYLIGVAGPEVVVVEVHACQPSDKNESAELSFVSNGNQENKNQIKYRLKVGRHIISKI